MKLHRLQRSEPPRRRFAGFAKGVLIGIGISLLVVAVVAVAKLRDPISPLDRKRLEVAADRWREHGPAEYDMELAVEGDQPARYDVQVRDGRVVRLLRDGQEQKQRGDSFEYWSVAGLLEIIEIDQDHVDDHQKDNPDERCNLRLAAEFDERYGYPRRYRRMMLDTRSVVDIRVIRFEPVEPD